jgi:arylformamidase
MQSDDKPADDKPANPAITRRLALGAAASMVAAPAFGEQITTCWVGPQPHPKGPLVFMNYDQVELDAAYTQLAYAPMGPQITARRASNSAEVRRRIGNPQRVSYGPSAIEKLDIFRTDKPNAPVFVFAHGGAWQAGTASEYHFAAEMYVKAGVNFVTLDFTDARAAGGDIRVMADQVQRGFAWVYKNAASFGGDPNRFYVGGQSSGAHLTGAALVSDWQKKNGVAPGFIKGALLLSGMYEMKPVRLSARSSYVKFDDAMEDQMSTIRHLENFNTPVTIMYGTYETPEFQRQSRDFAAALKTAGKDATLIVAPNYNHWELQETMANSLGWAGRAALAMMKLAPP